MIDDDSKIFGIETIAEFDKSTVEADKHDSDLEKKLSEKKSQDEVYATLLAERQICERKLYEEFSDEKMIMDSSYSFFRMRWGSLNKSESYTAELIYNNLQRIRKATGRQKEWINEKDVEEKEIAQRKKYIWRFGSFSLLYGSLVYSIALTSPIISLEILLLTLTTGLIAETGILTAKELCLRRKYKQNYPHIKEQHIQEMLSKGRKYREKQSSLRIDYKNLRKCLGYFQRSRKNDMKMQKIYNQITASHDTFRRLIYLDERIKNYDQEKEKEI